MANALTAVRLLLVLPFAYFMTKVDERSATLALAAWVVAVITDLLDGPIARKRGTVTALSQFSTPRDDHSLSYAGWSRNSFQVGSIFAPDFFTACSKFPAFAN